MKANYTIGSVLYPTLTQCAFLSANIFLYLHNIPFVGFVQVSNLGYLFGESFQRMSRGILCDVFSIIRYDLEDYKGKPAILEYYFMAVSRMFFFNKQGVQCNWFW